MADSFVPDTAQDSFVADSFVPDQSSVQARTQRVNQEIAQTPSAIGNFRSLMSGTNPTVQQVTDNPIANPVKTFSTMFSPIMAARQAVLGIPSTIVLDRMQGKPTGNLIQELGNVFQGGGQPTQQPGTIASDLRDLLAGRLSVGPGNVYRQAGVWGSEFPPARALVNNPDVTYGLVKSAPAMAEAASAGLQGLKTMGSNVANFVTGNPRGIESADTGVSQGISDLFNAYRKGGALHSPARSKLSAGMDAAFEPANAVADAVPGTINTDTLRNLAAQRFPEPADQFRLNQLNQAIFQLEQSAGKSDFTASELLSQSSKIGKSISRGVTAGGQSPGVNDLLNMDQRSVLLDAIEQAAPPEMQGSIQKAFGQYRDMASVRNQFYKTVMPGAGQMEAAGPGATTLRSSMGLQGNADQKLAGQQFVGNIRDKLGIDLTQPLQPQVQALQKAKLQGKIGNLVKWGGEGLGIAELVNLISGHHGSSGGDQ